MNPISEEQAVVLKHIKAGQNAVVNAVAGSGKSTTVLSIATSHEVIQNYPIHLQFYVAL